MEFKPGKERGAGDRIDDLKVLVISQGRCGGLLGVSWRDLRSESSVFEIEITGGWQLFIVMTSMIWQRTCVVEVRQRGMSQGVRGQSTR